MLSCYSAVLPFFYIVAFIYPLFGKKKGRGKTFSPTFKIASDSPKKSIPNNILGNKMESYTHFMILRTMTPVMQLFGNFHAAELEISAVISYSLYQISPIWCVNCKFVFETCDLDYINIIEKQLNL